MSPDWTQFIISPVAEVVAPKALPEPLPDLRALEKVQSVLYAQSTGPFLTYTGIPWTLEVRKEVGVCRSLSQSWCAMVDF